MAFSADSEVLEYMRSGSELEVLNRFPRVKAVFMKYNTATPSNAGKAVQPGRSCAYPQKKQTFR